MANVGIIGFSLSFILAVLLSPLARLAALRLGLVDSPDGARRRHTSAVPLLGGAAIFLAFWPIIIYFLRHPVFGLELIQGRLLVAFGVSVLLMIIGLADEWRPWSAGWRLVLTTLAAGLASGLVPWLDKITNPFGGFISLTPLLGGLLVFCWLMGMMYTVKILDGLDGLAAGIVAIGALMIYFLTETPRYYQPNVGFVALIFAGACLGFLLFNFYPAKIFLGESGGLFIGFMLGVLAIIGGGKLATALLVMAVPIFDLARVIYRRLRRRQSVFKGDREHLHFRLLDYGFSQRQVVLAFYALAFIFGAAALFLPSRQKLLALAILLALMIFLSWKIERRVN